MTKSKDKSTGKNLTRRSVVKGSTGLGLMLAAGVAPGIVSEVGASKMRKVKFMLPWLFVGGHTFEFAAAAVYWKKRGLDVSIQRGYGSGAAIKAVSSKTVNFAEASYGVAVNGVSKGLNVIAIGAKLQKSPIAISCRKDSGVKTPKDLEGKILVGAAASGDTLMMPGFARAAGIDINKINRNLVHPSKLISSVLNKQADCTGTYYVSNAASLASKTPAVHFMYADYGLQPLDLGLISRPDMVKNEPDLVQAIVDGAMEGLKLQLLDPGKSLDYMIAARPELKTKPRDLLLTHSGNTNFLSIGPAVEKNGLGWMDEADQTGTRNVVIKYMNAKNVPPISNLFTNKFAGRIKLTPAEWAKAKAQSAKHDPAKA